MTNQKIYSDSSILHSDLLLTKELIYDNQAWTCSNLIADTESSEYGAYEFDLNKSHIKFRVAKITPTKVGQFVTIWKRALGGPIQPFDDSDNIDFVVVCVRSEDKFGQFVFPKSVLCKRGVFTHKNKEGKRAIRVYPAWDQTSSKQAQATQKWQLEYFLEIPLNKKIDLDRMKALYLSPSATQS